MRELMVLRKDKINNVNFRMRMIELNAPVDYREMLRCPSHYNTDHIALNFVALA